jgi:hypothetical protein
VIRETKVEGQSDSLAERVLRRLGNDGDLSIAVRKVLTARHLGLVGVGCAAVWLGPWWWTGAQRTGATTGVRPRCSVVDE